VRHILDDAFDRLGLDDPERHLRAAIGRNPRDRVVEGVAVFEGKARRQDPTLPEDVNGGISSGSSRTSRSRTRGSKSRRPAGRGAWRPATRSSSASTRSARTPPRPRATRSI